MLNLPKEWVEIIMLLKLKHLQLYNIQDGGQDARKFPMLIIRFNIMRKWITFVDH
jgi:hypothetical protein